MRLNFTKMHSLGNDFVVLDAWEHKISPNTAQVRHLANRRTGIGCDQVLILSRPSSAEAQFSYQIYNADGRAAEQCGNGARCLGRYAADRGYGEKELQADSPGGTVALQVHDDDSVTVNMGMPKLMPDDIPFTERKRQITYLLEVGGQEHEISAVSMGNPHAVLEVDSAESAPVHTIGPRIETHPRFPQHANVGFMEISTPRHLRLRVWERGVGETPGCGSGACAAVVAGRLREQLGDAVTVSMPGGDLEVQWDGDENHPVLLRGSAEYSFEGNVQV